MDVTVYPWQRIKYYASKILGRKVRGSDNLENALTSQDQQKYI